MSIAVVNVLGRVNTQLRDPGYIRWPKSEVLDYFNDAVRAVVLNRPDASANIIDVSCMAGVSQALPETVYQLIDIVGQGSGRAVPSIDRTMLDNADPYWRATTGSPSVEGYIYSPLLPQVFSVYPGAEEGLSLKVAVSLYPVAVDLDELDGNDEDTPVQMQISDLYINPVVDWCLYRAFSKDAESGADSNLATQHLQNFNNALGIKTKVDRASYQAKSAQATGQVGA